MGRDALGMCSRSPGAAKVSSRMPSTTAKTYDTWLRPVQVGTGRYQVVILALVVRLEEAHLVEALHAEDLEVGPSVVALQPQEVLAGRVTERTVMVHTAKRQG
jgi:hypothetical protein